MFGGYDSFAMNISYKTFGLREVLPKKIIIPEQVHGNKIVEVVTGKEDLSKTDGVYARFNDSGERMLLGVKTADCAPVVFWDDEKYGVVHVGWRGLVDGMVENMLALTHKEELGIWVGPLLPVFEIQKDDCYMQIQQKFGLNFFIEKEERIYFQFKEALASLLPMAEFDDRSTFEDLSFASWRRDRDDRRNVTIVMSLG